MKVKMSKALVNLWYWLMKPLAYFFSSDKVNKRYEKKKEKITEQQAIKWIAEDIMRYVIKYKTEIEILICDFASSYDFDSDCTFYTRPYYIKRSKTRMAFYKFERDVEFQEKIISYIKELYVAQVIEKVEKFTWQRINNYQKTVVIKL
jgi:hypothetical protein